MNNNTVSLLLFTVKEKMRTSSEFVEILEKYLKEKKISRPQFCALVDIPNTTISSWKTKNTLPSIEFVAKIAKFMNVSLDWLVNGELYEETLKENSDSNIYSRQNILYRIEIILRQMHNDFDYDLESLHNKYLQDIVNYETLINWVNYKVCLPENTLPNIANALKVSLQWLLTQEGYYPDDKDNYLYELSKKYPNLLRGYNILDEEDQKFIDHYITSKLELRELKRQKEQNEN